VLDSKLRPAIASVCDADPKVNMNKLIQAFKTYFGDGAMTPRVTGGTWFDIPISFTLSKDLATSFTLDTATLLGDSSLPFGVGADGDLEIEADVTVSLPLRLNITGRSLSLASSASVVLLLTVNSNLDVEADFGPLAVEFRPTQVNFPGIQFSATFNTSKHISFDLIGTASVETTLIADGEALGLIRAEANLHALIKLRDSSALQVLVNVTELKEKLLQKLLGSDLSKFFSNTGTFLRQLTDGFSSFLKKAVGAGSDGAMRVPVLKNVVHSALATKLNALFGSGFITGVVNGITRNLTWIGTQGLDIRRNAINVLAEQFGSLLCMGLTSVDVLGVNSCPPMYTNSTLTEKNYTWVLSLGKTERLDLPDIDFALGSDSNPASLSLVSGGQHLDLTWSFKVNLTISNRKGLVLVLDGKAPILSAEAVFGMENPLLVGKLGFIGAAISFQQAEARFALDIYRGFKTSVSLNASFVGQFELGASRHGVLETDASAPLPHFSGDIFIGFSYILKGKARPYVKLSNVKMNVGLLAKKVIGNLGKKAEPVIGRLDFILNKNSGLLFKRVDGTELLYGRTLTVYEIMKITASIHCPKCNFAPVDSAITVYQGLTEVLESIQSSGEISWTDLMDLAESTLELNEDVKSSLSPPSSSPSPSPTPPTPTPAPPPSSSFSTSVTRAKEGKVGINMHILKEPMNKLKGILTGQNVALLGITIPKFTLAFSASWSVVIYTPPTVAVFVRFDATFTADVGEILFTSKGIKEFVQTKQWSTNLPDVYLHILSSLIRHRAPLKLICSLDQDR